MALKSNVIPIPSLAGARELYPAPSGGTRVPSSFGAADTTFGIEPGFLGEAYNANEYFAGARAQELEFRGQFYHGTQHDWRPYDQDGRMLGPKEQGGFAGQMQFLSSADNPSYVPLSVRRPNAPYRIAKLIVKEFTGLLFGQGRWPQVLSDDPESQAFAEEVVKAASFWNRFHRARDLGGSRGVAMISWFFAGGKPRTRVHNGRFCRVLKWADVDELLPAHVTELYQSFAERMTKDGPEQYRVWVRRDWTEQADIVFFPVEVTGDNPVEWTVDPDRTIEHGDGECHCVWLPNFADDEDPASTDGVPDYDTLYELLTTIDELNSLIVRGIGKNIDPTLVLKVEQALLKRGVVLKGSDNMLAVGETGSAEYLTLEGGVVEAGKAMIAMLRSQALETAQCVVPDPDKVAAAGTSSVAMKMMYALSLNAADLLREPYGKGIVRLLEQMQRSAARLMGAGDQPPEIIDVEVVVSEEDPANDQEGITLPHDSLPPELQEPEQRAVEYYFDLPDRVVHEPELDPSGNPTGKTLQRLSPVKPGKGSFRLQWGPYFPETAADKQAQTAALSAAAGGKAVMSQMSATEQAAQVYGLDATKETERMAAERKIAHDEEQGLFPAIGNSDGAALAAPSSGDDGDGLITPTANEIVVSVNEARARMKPDPLPPLRLPDGSLDPDGFLMVTAFKAKMEAKLSKLGEDEAALESPMPQPQEPAPGEIPSEQAEPPLPEPVEGPVFPVE